MIPVDVIAPAAVPPSDGGRRRTVSTFRVDRAGEPGADGLESRAELLPPWGWVGNASQWMKRPFVSMLVSRCRTGHEGRAVLPCWSALRDVPGIRLDPIQGAPCRELALVSRGSRPALDALCIGIEEPAVFDDQTRS